jgi:predicted nucleic-acid-binding protein
VIALDTNVIVRLIVQDDLRQASLVERLIQQASEAEEACFIGDPVLCELEWVLEKSYGAKRADILAAMQELAAREVFSFEDPETFRWALTVYQESKADFSDALIGGRAKARGARTTYTFDRALARQEGFSLLGLNLL